MLQEIRQLSAGILLGVFSVCGFFCYSLVLLVLLTARLTIWTKPDHSSVLLSQFLCSSENLRLLLDVPYLPLYPSLNFLATSGRSLWTLLVMVMLGICLKGYAIIVQFILCKALLQGLVNGQTVIQFSPCFLRAVMYFNPSLSKLLSHVCLPTVSYSSGRRASAFTTFYINQTDHVLYHPFFLPFSGLWFWLVWFWGFFYYW